MYKSPKDALCQVWLKLAQWFWRRRFLNFFNVFLLFCHNLPLEKSMALPWNKLESPSHKDALCYIRLKLAGRLWRRFLKFVIVSPWKWVLHLIKLDQTWIPITQRHFVPVWLKLAQWFWRRKRKCEKFTDRQRDNRRSEIQLRWAKKINAKKKKVKEGEKWQNHC